MKVLVLGGYGLIGREICRELLSMDIKVVCLARSAELGQRLLPGAQGIGVDLGKLTKPDDWSPYLGDIDGIINASGALQSGGRDNLRAVQRDAICALIEACDDASVKTFVQISAPGADASAETEFLSTKGEADQVLRESKLNWVVLKPGLVISSTAYGGTSLLRMLAAFPIFQPIVLQSARIQTVDVRDVARAVVRSLCDPSLAGKDFDLVELSPRSLHAIVLLFRQWLGFAAPRSVVKLPDGLGFMIARVADLAGVLGWRAPLRTTTLKVLAEDVLGDPEPWKLATGETMKSLPATLSALPSTRQERFFARSQLLFPLIVVMFSLFWLVSGIIGFWRHEAAASLISWPLGETLASYFVYAGSALDLLIGVGLLVQRTLRASCFLAIAASIVYLVAGTFISPELWADPLGPLVKIIPVIALASILAAMAEER